MALSQLKWLLLTAPFPPNIGPILHSLHAFFLPICASSVSCLIRHYSALLALSPAPEEVTRFSLDGEIMNLLPSDVVQTRLRVWLVHRQKNLLDLHLPSSIRPTNRKTVPLALKLQDGWDDYITTAKLGSVSVPLCQLWFLVPLIQAGRCTC